MSHVLGNPIILSSILENLTLGSDIASLCAVDVCIRQTAVIVIRHCHILRLSFSNRTRLKTKNLHSSPFDIFGYRFLVLLNLSGTGVTSAVVRNLLFDLKTLKFLQIVDCRKIDVASIINLLRTIVKLRFGKREMSRESFAPLVCLDCWGIGGLALDYKYQNKQEWFFESYCSDNRNLQTLLNEADVLGIDLNIQFCPGTDHNNLGDIRYHPAARQLWGYSNCTITPKQDSRPFVLCDTCILRTHNREGFRRHICRQPIPIDISVSHQGDL